MAKPTTYATPICIVLSILVIIGIVVGIWKHSPLLITILLLPAVGYEAYRTEGETTRWASWVMIAVIIAELIVIAFKINYDLVRLFDTNALYVGYTYLPLGNLKVMFPIIMIVLSFMLFLRTIGKYTKWLAILILISSIAIVYAIEPGMLKSLLHIGTDQSWRYMY